MMHIQKHKGDTNYTYQGIPIHAAQGLHEFAIEVRLNKCKSGSNILDLGCGSGAFTKRLQNHGYKTISVDLSLDTFKIQSESHELNFNTDFSEQLKRCNYDAIVALEVLEHLENPQHFLQQIKLIAGAQTVIIISFPNIYLYYSVYLFYKKGNFSNFSPFLYWETGHQSLISDWLFEEHLIKNNLIKKEKYFCAPVKFPENFFNKIRHFVFYKILCFMNNDINPTTRISDCVLYVLENPTNLY